MAERRVQARREAIVGIATGVVLGIGLIYLVGVNYVGGWKVAPDRCSSSAVSASDGRPELSGSSVHKTSAWLPYWECVREYRDGSTRRSSIHVWWP
jgi:hypothetical protein